MPQYYIQIIKRARFDEDKKIDSVIYWRSPVWLECRSHLGEYAAKPHLPGLEKIQSYRNIFLNLIKPRQRRWRFSLLLECQLNPIIHHKWPCYFLYRTHVRNRRVCPFLCKHQQVPQIRSRFLPYQSLDRLPHSNRAESRQVKTQVRRQRRVQPLTSW